MITKHTCTHQMTTTSTWQAGNNALVTTEQLQPSRTKLNLVKVVGACKVWGTIETLTLTTISSIISNYPHGVDIGSQ